MNQYLLISVIFLFGLSVGSFLNVIICRLETGEGVVKKRSHCPKCGENLAWYDLVPVLSFLLLRGHCRYCKKPISVQYPLVELATGILFLAVFWHLSPFARSPVGGEFEIWDFIGHWPLVIGHLVYWFFIVSCLIVIFVYDLRHYLIPDKIIYPAIAAVLLFRILNLGFVSNFETLLNPLLSAFAAAASFLALVLITRGRGMGLGDVKLAFLMGLVLGWPQILLALFLAFLSGALVGIELVLAKKKNWKSQIPFGPFLAASTVFVVFFGENLLNWYFTFLGF